MFTYRSINPPSHPMSQQPKTEHSTTESHYPNIDQSNQNLMTIQYQYSYSYCHLIPFTSIRLYDP